MAFLLTGFLLLLAASGAAQSQEPQESFEDEISVSLVEMVVRVVDTWGRPILDLKPEDFRVRVGKEEIPVAGLEWISAEDGEIPAAAAEAPDGEGQEVTVALPRPGRLVVFFVQADLNPTRISGQLRMRTRTRELLDTLHPGDRVAVVSYDSHLKMWQDFTRDREVVHTILDEAMLYSPEREIAPVGDPSLARGFDFAGAKKAASAERALELTARAMEPLPGEKIMIYLGWGLGRFGDGGVQMTPSYAPAVKALRDANASVFVLDVTSADYHSLEEGLEQVAADTGGLYLKTFRLPNLATEVLSKAISGYYLLTLDRGQMPADEGVIEVGLRQKRGTVLARPVAVR
ncbi:MAG TPA: VWA domain-containing protein [Thermoanaerobaculia bacterium]